jgi:hypothetical protein
VEGHGSPESALASILRGGNKRILLVDDERELARVGALLKEKRCRVAERLHRSSSASFGPIFFIAWFHSAAGRARTAA